MQQILLIGPPAVGKSVIASSLQAHFLQIQSLSIDEARVRTNTEKQAWALVEKFLRRKPYSLFESSGLSYQLWQILLRLGEGEINCYIICLLDEPANLHRRVENRGKGKRTEQILEDEHAFIDYSMQAYHILPGCDLRLHLGYGDVDELVLEDTLHFLWDQPKQQVDERQKIREIQSSLKPWL